MPSQSCMHTEHIHIAVHVHTYTVASYVHNKGVYNYMPEFQHVVTYDLFEAAFTYVAMYVCMYLNE